jgi:hypothetical protein
MLLHRLAASTSSRAVGSVTQPSTLTGSATASQSSTLGPPSAPSPDTYPCIVFKASPRRQRAGRHWASTTPSPCSIWRPPHLAHARYGICLGAKGVAQAEKASK